MERTRSLENSHNPIWKSQFQRIATRYSFTGHEIEHHRRRSCSNSVLVRSLSEGDEIGKGPSKQINHEIG